MQSRSFCSVGQLTQSLKHQQNIDRQIMCMRLSLEGRNKSFLCNFDAEEEEEIGSVGREEELR